MIRDDAVVDDGSPEAEPAVPHPDLLLHFGVFRRPQDAADLEDGVAPGPPATARFGLLHSQVRRVSVSGSLLAWVTPGVRGAALSKRSLDRDGAYSTATWSGRVESVGMRGLFGWSVSLEGVETYCGLVPDGNESVALTLIDGKRLTVPIIQNVFVTQPVGHVRTVEFRDGAGKLDLRETGH